MTLWSMDVRTAITVTDYDRHGLPAGSGPKALPTTATMPATSETTGPISRARIGRVWSIRSIFGSHGEAPRRTSHRSARPSPISRSGCHTQLSRCH